MSTEGTEVVPGILAVMVFVILTNLGATYRQASWYSSTEGAQLALIEKEWRRIWADLSKPETITKPVATMPIHRWSYQDGDTTVYVETMPNGDELVSEYSAHYQRAYVRPKEMLDYWKRQAKVNTAASTDDKPSKA